MRVIRMGPALLRRGPQDPVDGAHQLVPAIGLRLELAAALWRQAVIARAPVVFGGTPERRDPAAVLEAVESRIERAVLDLKNIFRTMLDGVGDGVAVRGAERQRLEHQDVERPLEHVAFDGRRPAPGHAPEDNLVERRLSTRAGRRTSDGRT